MSVNPELFENLRPRKIIDGEFYIEGSESNNYKPIKMQMFVSPSGGVFARPVALAPIDQSGEIAKTPVGARHQGVDQV